MKHSSGWQADWAVLRPDQKAAILRRNDWLDTARPEQVAPPGRWRVWLVLAGRGFGKTRTANEDAAWYGATNPGHQIAMVAPTFGDVRGTVFEGVSGLLACVPHECIAEYNKARQELVLTNGALFRGFSADTPDRLRGPQFHRAYCDELAAWSYADAWDQLMFGLRLGVDPRVIVTTTPRPTPLVRALVKAPGTHVTRGSTFDNAANLAPTAIAALREKYDGTRLGRQELYAEILDDVPGALWTRDAILHGAPACDLARVVVAVDPSGAGGTGDGDDIGIVVAGKGADGRFYVLEDATCNLSPAGWARVAVGQYHKHRADKIVAEANFGGAMVEATIKTADRSVPVKMVSASRGKAVRAEPIAALYEQGRVSHAPGLERLEDQMMQMALSGYMGDGSPDRVDALVWALTELSAPVSTFQWSMDGKQYGSAA
jgi:predicted phage terminase large subunit-like protein